MGFGPTWGPGQQGQFEMIDFGYNTAGTEVLADLRARLAAWLAVPQRESLLQMQRDTVLGNLYRRIIEVRARNFPVTVPPLLANAWSAAQVGRTPAEAEAWFTASIQKSTAAIDASWFPRDGSGSQWIHDSRRSPAEVEAMMIRAKLEVCDLMISGQAERCRWLGQCEWPEFSVRVALDDATRTAEVWVYGPDNGMAEDPVRQAAPRLLGPDGPLVGRLVVTRFTDLVPDVSTAAASDRQRVPYVPSGPSRPITEIRWQTTAEAGTAPGPVAGPVPAAADNRGPLLRLPGPIPDQEIDVLEPELRRLQGNILRSHGRRHAAHVMLRFRDPDAARVYLASVPLTTAAQQRTEANQFRLAADGTGSGFIGLGLSAAGYGFLGLEADLPTDPLFRDGMAASRSIDLAGDPPVDTWDAPYSDGVIHAVLILAHSDPDGLIDLISAEQAKWTSEGLTGIEEVVTEIGSVLKNSNDDPIEPFGFADNLSQPLFFQEHVDRKVAHLPDVYDHAIGQLREAADGDNGWSFGFPPRQVLVPDGAPVDGHTPGYGSYLVFRKLEQDLPGFHRLEQHLATSLQLTRDRAGTQIMGRDRNGIPALGPMDAVPPPGAGKSAARYGDYVYSSGSGCPFAAHARRMNDREELGRRRVMARRGIPYNDNEPFSTVPPLPTVESGVGLLFQACVWDIQEQFADVQRAATRPTDHGSPDLLLGSGSRWWADPTGRRASVDLSGEAAPLVRLRGGEYFFLPSPEFLASLAPSTTA